MPERLVDSPKLRLIGYSGRCGCEVLHVNRFGQEIFGAELHGSNGGGDISLAGEEDDRGIPLAEMFQHLHSIHARQAQIENDNFWSEAVECGQACLPAELPGYLVA
jgi:hypothetical protein